MNLLSRNHGRSLVFGMALLLLTADSQARWLPLSLERAVQQSDVIVVGVLDGVHEWTKGGKDYGAGEILVEQVLWGDATERSHLALRWQNLSGTVCPRVNPVPHARQSGVWLLERDWEGFFLANHPSRYLPLDRLSEVKVALRAENAFVDVNRPRGPVADSNPNLVDIVYRNSGPDVCEFPGIDFDSAGLTRSNSVGLILLEGPRFERRVEPRRGAVTIRSEDTPVSVAPGKERRVTVDVSALYPIDPLQFYKLQLWVDGLMVSEQFFVKGRFW